MSNPLIYLFSYSVNFIIVFIIKGLLIDSGFLAVTKLFRSERRLLNGSDAGFNVPVSVVYVKYKKPPPCAIHSCCSRLKMQAENLTEVTRWQDAKKNKENAKSCSTIK